jgi:hypothetical protein
MHLTDQESNSNNVFNIYLNVLKFPVVVKMSWSH